MQPRFPIFVPTLTRYDTRMTIKALQRMKIENWFAVVEPHELELYSAVIPRDHIILLDLDYKQKYETLDDLGMTKSVGPGAARNFIWDTSIRMGYEWHWVMDDNIRCFLRATNSLRHEVLSGAFFRIMEDFVLRYENVAMAGPNYRAFLPPNQKRPPFTTNTRIYSCNLIRNELPYRWRGRYNEDTILSLDMLSAGWCTVQFNAFQQDKMVTQKLKGGCNKVFYSVEGTYPKSKMLVDAYPQYATLKYMWGRAHHKVDYRPFLRNKLRLKPGVNREATPDYGMTLVTVKKPKKALA